MRTYTVTEYEQEDFDAIEENMTADKAIEVLGGLPRGWFPYRLPRWGDKISRCDLDNFEICCAIQFAIERIKAGEHYD